MPPDPAPTRRSLLDAALRLFAERGANAVPITDVNRAAGQRNNAALAYHFGGRHGVLRAILDEFTPGLRARRLELLQAATAADPYALRPVVAALVVPVAELLGKSWRERSYLLVCAELAGDPAWANDALLAPLTNTGTSEVFAELWRRCPEVGHELRTAREFMLSSFLIQSCAAQARAATRRRHAAQTALVTADFTDNLVDMVAAAVAALPHIAAPIPAG